MKKWMCIRAAVVLTISVLAGCGANAGATTTAARTETSKEEASKAETAKKETTKTSEASEETRDTVSGEIQAVAGKHHVKTSVKDYGTISVELCGDEAPITAANFLKLTKDGSYNGLTFHHTISDFVTQGGDPLGTGMGGSDQEVKGELSNSGVKNPLSHTRGAISVAHSQMKNGASSQFFIVHEDNTFLGGDYACFGCVTEGMEVVDAICEDAKVEGNNGSVAEANQPVIGSIEVVG